MSKLPLILSSLVVLAPAGCTTDDVASTNAPTFLAFGANKSKLVGEGDHLVITAALTDPDGIDDVVGGTLLRTADNVLVGAFATSAAEGAYSMDVDVKTLLGDTPVPRKLDASVALAVTAEFFDQSGNKASNSLDVTFECPKGRLYVNGSCAESFEYEEVDDQCIVFHALVNTDMTCGEVCSALLSTTAPFGASDRVRVRDTCTCGPCI